MDRGRAAAALLALAACVTISAAAPTTNQTALDLYEKQTEGCYYNFQHYGEGDRIMTNEPCLNCTCHNRMLMCYLRVCPFTKAIGQDCTVEKRADQCCPIVTCPDVPVDLLTSTSTTSPSEYGGTGVGKVDNYGCTINGKYLPEGSKVPQTPNKPCEHCYCIRNMTTCVMQECTLHVDGCTPIYHKDVCCPIRYFCDHPEDEIPLLDDMTTTVRPTPGFLLTTTTEEPTTEVAVKKECVDHDHLYTDGALIPSDKPCVHCYCMKGDIVCVVQECGAPMENEGKNCTSLPPREGHCCPDTYICEGDEISNERVTESISGDFTTLEPPRRVNIEGSGYRVEPESTHIPETLLEIEGSGDESTTTKSSKTSEAYPTLQPLDDELDDKFSPIETDLEHHPITTESSLSENSYDITTEPDRGLNTIEYELTDSDNYDKTTQKQYDAEQSFVGKTTISGETRTTSFPYEEDKTTISIDGSSVPSISHTTTHRGSIDHDITTESSIDAHAESSTSSYLESTKTTVPEDQNIISEGSGQGSLEPEINNEATTQISDESRPDKTSDESITTPIIDINTNEPLKMSDDSTENSIDVHKLTTENILSLEESTEKDIEKLTTLMHTTESEMSSSTQTGQIDVTDINVQGTTKKDDMSSLEQSTIKYMDKLTTLLPELIHSTESEMLSSTQTGQIDEKDITTQETTKKEDILSLEESTEKVMEKLTTLLPEIIHSTESEMSSSTQTELIDENAITTHVTTEKDDMLSLEKSTEKSIDKLTTLLPELIHSTESDLSISSQSGLDIISTTTATDKQETPEITTINPVDNEIDQEIIPPGRIPGEGDCLQNGITYLNESSVPSNHKCQTRCKCVSSIIKCDPILCMPQPENMGKCHRIYDSPESCCPTYVCDHSKDTTPPESHSQMSGTESSILPSSDCNGDNCEMHEDKSPTTTIIPEYERPIQPLDCTDGKCQAPIPRPTIEDQSHTRPVDQDQLLKPQDCIDGKCQSAKGEHHTTPASPDILRPQEACSGGKCDLPSIDVSPLDCSDGKCALPPAEDESHTTPASSDILPPHEDCSGGKCDLPKIDVSPPDCSDGKCTLPPAEDESHTTPASSDILPPHVDCSGGKCDLPTIDVSPPDCSDGKCTLPPAEDESHTTPASSDLLPPHKDCSSGKCDLPTIDVSPPDCSDGKCTLPPAEDESHTTPASLDILPPHEDCSGGKCDLPTIDVSPPDCSDGKCTLPPIEDEPQTTPASSDILPPQKDCSGGKCDLPSIDVSPLDCSDGKCTLPTAEDESHTTPASSDILPPHVECSGGKCDLPTDVSPPDCSDGKCTLPPAEDESHTTPASSDILPPHEDCSGGTCDLPSIDVSPPDCSDGKCTLPPTEYEPQTTPASSDILPPQKNCSGGKCDLPSIDVSPPDCSDGKCTLPQIEDESHTTPATPDIPPSQEDCSDGKCDLPSIDVSPPDCSDGKCTLPTAEDESHTTPASSDILPPHEDCSGGKCDLPTIDVSPPDCSDGKCTLAPAEDESHTTPASSDILQPHEDCSGGKCDLPTIDVSPPDCSDGKCTLPPIEDEPQTTPAGSDILPPQKDCSGGKCDLPSIDVSPPDCSDGKCTLPTAEDESHTTPASSDILPPHVDCSGGKCDLPTIDVSPPDCSDGKCTLPPAEDESHTTPASSDILPPHEDCSGGKCDLPTIDVSPPDCGDGKCTLPPAEDESHTTPASLDILPPHEDCSGGKCDLPTIDVSPPDCSDGKCTLPPIEVEPQTTPASSDILPPHEDCSGGKCDLPTIDVSPPDCSDGKCTLPPIEDEPQTTPASSDILPPQKDCSGGKCDLPSIDVSQPDCSDGKCTLPQIEDESHTTPATPDIPPSQEDCSDGKCDLPSIDVSPLDCSDGKCTLPPTEDESYTTPTSSDILPPQEDCSSGKCVLPAVEVSPPDCSDGKCTLPPIEDESHTTSTTPDISPSQEDCSGGKCDLPTIDVSPPDCSDGKCTLPPAEDESHTTPASSDLIPPHEDCGGGKCDLPTIDVSPPDCSDGKCTLPSIEDEPQTTPASSDILPPQKDCSGGKCDLPSIDVSPPDCSDGKCILPQIEGEPHTTPASPDILPPQTDCSGGKCDLPSDDVSDKIPIIIPTEISKEPCEGEHCAEANEVCTDGNCIVPSEHPGQEQICTDDNCRRTEISETGVPVSCKEPDCMPSTGIPIYPSYETQGPIELPVSTEVINHDIHTESPQSLTTITENAVTGDIEQSETEKPFKSSDLPETDKNVLTTNVIEEPTTQSMETVTKYSTDTGITSPSLLTEATTSKINVNYEPVTQPIDDLEAFEKLPKSTSAVETEISTKSSLDNIEQSTESHKTTSLSSHDNDVIVSEQSTPIDISETETPILEVTTEQKPIENVSEEQMITKTPDIMTTKVFESDITEKPASDVSPTKTTEEEEHDFVQHTTSLPEVIETESPLSQFTLQDSSSKGETQTQGSIQDEKTSINQDITTMSSSTESLHSKDDVTTELEISESQTKSPDNIYSTRLPEELKPQTDASPVLYEADTESTPIAEEPVQTEKITEPSIISGSEETTTSSTIDITKQPENLATEQPNIIDLTETTPYLVELEEHPHKIDDVSSSPSPAEQTTTYQQETQTTDSSSDRIPITELHTESTAGEMATDKLFTTTISSEITGSDNRGGSVTTLAPTQLLDEQHQITQETIKPLYSGESTESNANITSPTSISITTSKSEHEITTQSSYLDHKFGDEKLSTITSTTSATGTSKPTFDELLPTDDALPSDDSQFPPSGGYGQETDYSDEDQAFGPGTCRYGGKVYVSAQQIPRDDPCDFCFCFRSDIICLQQSCPPPIHGCHEEPIQGFCCPRYECPVAMATALNLTTTTTTTTTTLPPHFLPHAYKGAAQRKGCQIKGHTYKVGEVVRASSGPCLHCTCGGDGQMKCDPKVCTPEPMLRQMIAAAVSAKRRR